MREAEPLAGTLGERYFRDTRGVDPDRAELHLLFHPAASCSELGKGKTMAAVICAFRTEPEGDPVAVHMIYVGTNGSKPSLEIRKRTFGHWKDTGAALYLMPVGKRTIVAEGIEKALRCSNVTGLPCIAAGNDGAMKGMLIPDGVEELIICADRGDAGERAAARLATRAHGHGVKVRICYPPVEGKDWDSDECTADAVRETIENAPIWEPGPEPPEWREPEPIEAPLLPVPPFDADALLPDGLRDFVVDTAYRMCAPVEYVAVSSLSITSSLIGANCAIRPKRADNWLIVPNLWGAIVGEPSQMKSPAMNAAARPLEQVIARVTQKHADAIADAEGDTVTNEARREAHRGEDQEIDEERRCRFQ